MVDPPKAATASKQLPSLVKLGQSVGQVRVGAQLTVSDCQAMPATPTRLTLRFENVSDLAQEDLFF